MTNVGPIGSDAWEAFPAFSPAGQAEGGGPDGPVAQLAAITQAGLPLAAGLRACAEESPSFRDARELRRLAQFVERGGTLDEAARNFSRRSRLIWPLLAAGMKSGRLPRVLECYLITTRQNRALWRRFWMSLLYPALVLWAGMSVLMLAMIFVVPMFREIFADFGVELPGVTLVLLAVSEHLQLAWPFYAFSGGALAALVLAAPWLPMRSLWEWVPLVGRASLRAGCSDFCSLLSVFVEAEAPLPDAVRCLSRVSKSARLRRCTHVLARRLDEGLDPRDAAETTPRLPWEIRNAFRWAGERDRFAAFLRQTAQGLAARARVNVMQMGFFIEPVAIVLLGLVTGFVVIGLFLPLVRLLGALS